MVNKLQEKLDNTAIERFGEFGYSTCSAQEQMEVLIQLSNEQNRI